MGPTRQELQAPIRLKIDALNKRYSSNEISRRAYLNSHKALVSKLKNVFSVSNQIKRFGAYVKKTENSSGYTYHGKNFKCDIFLDGCVTDFWNYILEDDCPKWLYYHLDEMDQHPQKSDLLYTLLTVDQNFEQYKNDSDVKG